MSNWLTQAGRFLELTTPLGPDVLIPLQFSGVEHISGLFDFTLTMMSDQTDIDAQQLLGKPISVKLNFNDTCRYFHGRVTSFNGGATQNGARFYTAQLEPWLALLSYHADCRMFHNKSVIDMAKTLFQELGFSDFSTQGLTQSYAKRDYCTQYRETTLHFLNRLFQEEGIFYFFRHEADKHTLVLADTNSNFPVCENSVIFDAGSYKNFGLTAWQRQKNFYSGAHQHTDYNYEQAGSSLYTQQQGNAKLAAAGSYSRYDYPGRYQDSGAGNTWSQQRLQAHEVNYDLAKGKGNYPTFFAGGKFTLDNAPIASDDGNYVVLSMTHMASDNSYLAGTQGSQTYVNEFTCLPATADFRPMHSATKPLIHGTQTAIVVGQEGSEIYTDEHGRVKVQFHWDRKGEEDEYSSCWIRVAHPTAGANWGSQFMPRIGQEVVVSFLDGDPDRPLITGSVYNSNNAAPYNLPQNQTQSGIKTRSSQGGGAADFNELRFEDKMGSEEIFIQAQKDFNQTIKNNLAVNVVNDHTHATTHNSTVTVGNDYSHATSNNSTMTVGNDYSQSTANNASMNVGNNFTQIVQNSSETVVGTTAITEATESIILQVGQTMLIVSPAGVTVKGPSFKVDKS